MSYTKTDWANLPSTTTPVNATNLAKIETELETLDNAISNFVEYSTSEKIVGRWLDGKPIYKKTITVNNTALVAGSNMVAHGISNLGQVVKLETARVGSQMFPYINLDANNTLTTGTFITNVDNTNIIVRVFNDSWGTSNIWYFTLFYTKTTD